MSDTIPNAALDNFDLGAREYVDGQNQKALEYFDRAIAGFEAYDQAHYMRGLALLRLGRADEAVVSLQKTADITDNVMLRGYARTKVAQVAGGPDALQHHIH